MLRSKSHFQDTHITNNALCYLALHRTTWISSNTTVFPGEGELALSLHCKAGREKKFYLGVSVISLILGTDCRLVLPVVGGKIHSTKLNSDYDCIAELCREITNVVTCGPARFFILWPSQVNKLTSVFYASVLLLIMNFVITLSK